MRHLESLPAGFLEIGAAMFAVAIVGVVALVHRVRRFDGLLLWALGATTGAWLIIDHVHEVAILWTVTATHGLTVADLAAIPSVLVAAALGLRSLLPAPTKFAPAHRAARHRGLSPLDGSRGPRAGTRPEVPGRVRPVVTLTDADPGA